MNAIGYIRISTKDQSQYSLEYQERNVRQYCDKNDLNLLALFKDDGESSYTFDRPDWNALEKFIRTNKSVQYLIIFDHDRFSRNLAEALMKIKELQDKFGIKVLATSDSFDTDFSDPSVFMMRAFKYMMAENELWRIRQRTKSGMLQAALNGRYVSQAPIGYINTRDENDKPLLKIDEDKAYIVRIIFKEYNAGKGIEEIRKIITPYGFKLKGSSAIQHILGNPVYAGLIRVPAHKDRPETIQKAIHQGIVSESEYWQAQYRLNHKKITTQKNTEVPLRGVLKCAKCMRTMTAGNSKGRNKYYWYYLCESHRDNLPAAKLHRQLGEILDIFSFDEDTIESFREDLSQNISTMLSQRGNLVAKTQKALRGVCDKVDEAEEKYLLGGVNKKTFDRIKSNLIDQKLQLEQRLAQLDTDHQVYYQKLNKLLPKLHDIRSAFEALDLVTKQQFISLVFKSSLRHDGEVYRTAFIDPLFAHNALELKEKGLLEIEQSSHVLELTPISAPYRSPIESLLFLADLLAA